MADGWFRKLIGKEARSSDRNDQSTALGRVTRRVTLHGNPEAPGTPVPLLTLEEFFEGNHEVGSIGCNLPSVPAPSQFYSLLKDIRDRPDVSDVRVQITCLDAPGEEWPFSDTIWVVTSADETAVRSWFEGQLAPDEVWTGWQPNTRYEDIEIADGHLPVAIWYD